MRRFRLLGAVPIAVLALTGAASAHVFEASKAGALKRVSNSTQIFKTGAGPTIECSTDEISNSNVPAGDFLLPLLDLRFHSCHVKFIFEFEATVSDLLGLISADEIAVTEVTILILVPVAKCTITISPQKNLSSVHFKNSGSDVVIEPNITNLTSTGSGGECGSGTTNKGTYTGNTTVELVGGTLAWK